MDQDLFWHLLYHIASEIPGWTWRIKWSNYEAEEKKNHLCGGCDKLVILYLQIANYSSDWLLSDQFACAVMVTGLQIRCRISCGSDVAFSSCSLGSKTHG